MTQLTRTRRRDLNAMQREIDRLFNTFFPSTDADDADQAVWAPRTDLVETEKAFVLHLDLPGVSRDDVSIHFQDDTLSISGERAKDAADASRQFVRVERNYGRFFRSFRIPRNINTEAIEAGFEHGVLTVTLPKHEESLPRQIDIS